MKLYNEGYTWYKGNMHTHTTCSDGRKTPEEAIEIYRAAGYDFLAFTDHWYCGQTHFSGDMLVLSGIELDTMRDHEGYHIVGVGMKDAVWKPQRGDFKNAQACVDGIRAAGGIAILAHPSWSLLRPDHMAQLENVTAAEIMNSVSRPPFNGDRGDSSVLLDVCAAMGKMLPLVAGDDSHFYQGEECRCFVKVNAPELTREGILSALESKRFYASEGPEIHQITVENGQVTVTCSPCEMVLWESRQLWNKNRVQRKNEGTSYTYSLTGDESFLRVELHDKNGLRAWSGYIDLQ